MNIILPIIFFLFFAWGVYKWSFFNIHGISRKFLLTAFFLKVLAGFLLTMIYTYHYDLRTEADTFRYFDDSYYLHKAASENPKAYLRMMFGIDDSKDLMPYLDSMNNWFPAERTTFYNDNRTVIRINALIRWIPYSSYYVHMLIFCFMAFYGLTFIYKAFNKYFAGKKTWLGLILFFTPSIVFWSSGILKEGPLLLVFGIALNILNKIFIKRAHWQHYTLLIFCFLFLFHLKFYVGLLLFPAITGYTWILKTKGPHPIIKIILNFSAYFGVAVVWHLINWNWSLFTVLKWKRLDFIGLAESMNANSFITTGELEDNPISFLQNFGWGFFNAITRPFPWEVYSLVILPNAIENILIIIFIVFCVIFGKIKNFQNIGYFFFIYAFGLLTIIGMVTPIMGSLVRYKTPAIPFLLMFFLLFLKKEKSKKILSIFNKNIFRPLE